MTVAMGKVVSPEAQPVLLRLVFLLSMIPNST